MVSRSKSRTTQGAKKAAIGLDKIGNKKLSEISAADFLDALNSSGVTTQALAVWPEKKKLELHFEPENTGKLVIKDLINIIRGEKKKREYELPFLGFQDVVYENLLDRLVTDIEKRIR